MKSTVVDHAGLFYQSLSWNKVSTAEGQRGEAERGTNDYQSLFSIESKAQMHFRQLAFLSGLVNRTVILPNVGGSRLGACLGHDFEFYYSRRWAIDHQSDFQHITMTDFKQWLIERQAIDRPATSQSMHIHVNLRGHAVEPTNCFAQQNLLNMIGLPERRLYLNETANPRKRLYYQDAVKDFFLGIYRDADSGQSVQDQITDKIEVLSIYYDRR